MADNVLCTILSSANEHLPFFFKSIHDLLVVKQIQSVFLLSLFIVNGFSCANYVPYKMAGRTLQVFQTCTNRANIQPSVEAFKADTFLHNVLIIIHSVLPPRGSV